MRQGSYCANCGERSHRVDLSLRGFVWRAVQTFTSLENRFWSTLWNLVRRPGKLSYDTARGSRARAVGIFQLFLIVNAIYFLAPYAIRANFFTSPFSSQMYRMPYSDIVRPLAKTWLETSGLTFAEFEPRYTSFVSQWSKLLVIALVPLLAVVFRLLFAKRRRYTVEHLWISLEFWSFFLLFVGLGGVAAILLVSLFLWLVSTADIAAVMNRHSEPIAGAVVCAICGPWLYSAFRRFYGANRWSSLLRIPVTFFGLLVCVTIYRVLLLFAALAFA